MNGNGESQGRGCQPDESGDVCIGAWQSSFEHG